MYSCWQMNTRVVDTELKRETDSKWKHQIRKYKRRQICFHKQLNPAINPLFFDFNARTVYNDRTSDYTRI